MRVAQVVGKLAAGGVEAVVNTYYRRLDHTRIQFDYFIDEDSPCEPPEKLIALGARYYRIPPTTRPIARVLALRRLFAQNCYPIVHAHMTTLNLPVLLAARWAGVPVRISHAHSTSAPGEGARGLLKGLLRPTARLFATHFMACGQATAQWMFPRRLIDADRVTILPNAVDVGRFRFSEAVRTQARARLGLQSALVVGHVGRFMRQKNHAFLLEIFAALHARRPDAVLLLVGDGELRAGVEAQAAALGLTDCVRFLGIRHDLQRLYCAMDVFVLPSFYEGLPVVGVEAQACGLPCLVSDAVDAHTAVCDAVRFLPLRAGALAWAQAAEALAAPVRARQSGAQAVRRAGLDIGDTVQQLSGLYEALAAGGGRHD